MSLRSEILSIGAFGGRIAISEVVLFSIFLTDILMLGMIGELSLSAALLINSSFVLCFVTALGFLQGALPLASAQWETDNHAGFNRTVSASLCIAAAISILFALLFIAYVPALKALSYPSDLIAEVWIYLIFILPGFAMTPFYIVTRNAVIATGSSRGFMTLSLVALVLNAVANYVLGFGVNGAGISISGMGIAGIGLSSSIVELLLAGGFWLLLRRTGFRFRLPRWPELRPEMWQLTLLGLPIGMIFFVDTTLFSGVLIIVGRHDIQGMAAMALIFEWVALAVMIPVGLSEAIVQRVAMIKAAGNQQTGVPLLVKAVGILTGVYLMFLALIQFGFGLNPPEFFIVDRDAHPGLVSLLGDFAVMGFVIAAMNAFIIMIAGILRGLLDMMVSMYAIVVCYWGVGIGMTFIFMEILNLGTYHAFMAVVAGTILATFVVSYRLHRLMQAL